MTEVDQARDAGIAVRVAEVRARIRAACARSGRGPDAVRLIAVTKSQTPDVLPALAAAGVLDFGENRVEHLTLMHAAAPAGARFHAIGRIQSRQLPELAAHSACLHSLCDLDHARKLARLCADRAQRLPVFVQVNASGEASKGGVESAALPALLDAVRALPGLDLIGLMTMAPELGTVADEATVRRCFARVRELAAAADLPRLSMGMSGDFGIAVEEGATDVRVGTRLFSG